MQVCFIAIVTHTPGGSCGFQQRITNFRLMKLNPEFDISDELLLSCAMSMVTCGNNRVSLSRGNDPGYEFVFMLTGANLNYSGIVGGGGDTFLGQAPMAQLLKCFISL